MKYLLSLGLFLLLSGFASAQTNAISNVKIRVSSERDMVTITYDLARNSRISFYNITVDLTLGGNRITRPAGLSGDLGGQVTAGLGKKIIWDTRQDITVLEGKLEVEVLTTTSADALGAPCTPIKTIPAMAGLGGAMAAGAGLLLTGLGQKGESNDLYAVYAANTNPSATPYANLSRDEYYQEANSKHKSGAWLTAAGSGIILAGGAVFLTRLLKINAYNKKCREGQPVSLAQPRLRLEHTTAGGPGLGLIFEF